MPITSTSSSGSRKSINWQLDRNSAIWAKKLIPDCFPSSPEKQFNALGDQDCGMLSEKWSPRLLRRKFPHFCYDNNIRLRPTPANIVRCLATKRFVLEGVALTSRWGRMDERSPFGRALRKIYALRHENEPERGRLEQIRSELTIVGRILDSSALGSPQLEKCWAHLVKKLDWSPVMTSKILHFLCRSRGIRDNPPVAIDNACMRTWLWKQHLEPRIRQVSRNENMRPPKPWTGDSWQAYNRYFTWMLVWSSTLGWTTTEVETTLFTLFRFKKAPIQGINI